MSAAPGSDLIPTDTIEWFFSYLQLVVWADDPRDQIAANVLFFIISLVSSWITFGTTLVLAAIFGGFGLVGIVRLAYRQLSG